ncbi:MAG: hypothetical protein HQL44_11240 [Alphaproteobacteria bacterium]|nr:hypothetical protein [Alphaproteobacteria bacterium]
MNKMLEKALTELQRQPDDMQEFVACLILNELESEKSLSSLEGKNQLRKAIQLGLDQLDEGQGLDGAQVLSELKSMRDQRRHA